MTDDPTHGTDASSSTEPKGDAAPDATGSFKSAAGNLGEIGAYALQYASAQVDRTVAAIRNAALSVFLGIVAGVIALAIAVTSAALLVIGLAQGVAAAISDDPSVGAAWHGNVIVGGVLSLVTVLGVWLVSKWIKSAAFAATVRRYERMQQAQRDTVGHTAGERAAEKIKAKANDDTSHH
ncbi:MAG: hypothetical protein AAGD32_01345 [Planctomycetota bacterium]